MALAVASGFDRVARAYRWLEYLSLGPVLARTRTHFLPLLHDCRRALVLGDGDGRFTAALLHVNPVVQVTAVDLSAAMLDQLSRRAARAHPTALARLAIIQQDALTFVPTAAPDLVVTHFFLDCLTQPQLEELAANLAPRLAPNALWVVSDFRIPDGPLRLPARLYVRSLYLAFRILTGLRTTSLPNHKTALQRAGLTRTHRHLLLFGLLTTEIWQPN